MHDDSPAPGVPVTLAPGLRRVIAPNPGPMTYWGTNTYLLGTDSLAVIDPGPDMPAHRAALGAAIGAAAVSHVIVTHSHLDHSPLARWLAAETGAPVCGFGPSAAGRSAAMAALAAQGLDGGGEGVDAAFTPDIRVPDGAMIAGAGWQLLALHTPGHMGNHLSLRWGDAVFSGDLVMGWASTLISPPDGDVGQFLASCARLKGQGARVLYPGHGAPVTDPAARIDWLVAHRAERTAQIRAALAAGPATVPALTARIYTDLAPALQPAAARNVFAHLVALAAENAVRAAPALRPDAVFSLA